MGGDVDEDMDMDRGNRGWVGLEVADGRLLALDTGTISVLGYERETAVVERWNS